MNPNFIYFVVVALGIMKVEAKMSRLTNNNGRPRSTANPIETLTLFNYKAPAPEGSNEVGDVLNPKPIDKEEIGNRVGLLGEEPTRPRSTTHWYRVTEYDRLNNEWKDRWTGYTTPAAPPAAAPAPATTRSSRQGRSVFKLRSVPQRQSPSV